LIRGEEFLANPAPDHCQIGGNAESLSIFSPNKISVLRLFNYRLY